MSKEPMTRNITFNLTEAMDDLIEERANSDFEGNKSMLIRSAITHYLKTTEQKQLRFVF